MKSLSKVAMVGLDLDGTLLNSDQTISPATINQLKFLHEKGIKIGIVTGRTLQGTMRALEGNDITPALGFPVFLIVNERDVYELNGDSYKPQAINEDALQQESQYLAEANQVANKLIEQVPYAIRVNDSENQKERGFVQLRFASPEDSFDSLGILEELTKDLKIRPVRNTFLIDLRADHVGKGKTLQRYVESQQIPHDSVLVIGDSQNDIGMLRRFIPATTDNADPDVKELVKGNGGVISSHITSDGVGEVLRLIS